MGLLLIGVTTGTGPVCHIHPPASDSAQTPPIVGPYPSGEACELANERLFGGQGRCHCAFDWGAASANPFLPVQPVLPEDPALDARPIR